MSANVEIFDEINFIQVQDYGKAGQRNGWIIPNLGRVSVKENLPPGIYDIF